MYNKIGLKPTETSKASSEQHLCFASWLPSSRGSPRRRRSPSTARFEANRSPAFAFPSEQSQPSPAESPISATIPRRIWPGLLLEWHSISQFCGHCGEKTVPKEAWRRKQCSSGLCRKRVYPRVDPVVIMLVIDRENDRALLSRQSRFVPRMWSCLAGFIEPGESLEEAVRRETWEETGIEVGEVVYHSSQPWPVGPNSMPGQLMVGFFAYAKSLEINVDGEELDDIMKRREIWQ
ncbi:nudix hydrolase 19, chloroplastic-like [Pyrus x bretschneideri]|uniref:nudix hydrolase 19, chloroplastic-like n=1 Tax=Pyrus x bretschneideri TaxID=225117 RepID=UPI00202EC3BE|nr:nudix hydrolase 19, chloroplastic-like [Pyrus x bretschneideri]